MNLVIFYLTQICVRYLFLCLFFYARYWPKVIDPDSAPASLSSLICVMMVALSIQQNGSILRHFA
jgi:hypothetical protein